MDGIVMFLMFLCAGIGMAENPEHLKHLKYDCLEMETNGICTMEYDPICFVKKVDYDNDCLACEGKKRIRFLDGPCDDLDSLPTPTKRKCLERETEGACPRILKPVCALERKTASNKCFACFGQSKIRYTVGEC
uniref:Serine protease inhibitor n=1 Tax=Polyandrocarpa misakiensis TaxID=7723 RepID=O77038_POLMI|nr:P-serpin 2 [Polyandrocarpa misakiensis]BAC10637.1 serine protease inhibitor [Polyandrocarpa misakiensis]